MRVTILVGLLLLLDVSSSAQAIIPEPAPDLAVIKHSWSKERINWEGDPFGGPVETFDDVRRRRVDERRMERAKATGNVGEASKVEREMRAEQVLKARPPAPPRYGFIYKVSVKNTGAKTIKRVDWDFLFKTTTEGDGHLQFTSDETIAPGKTKELLVMSHQPPARTVSVYELGKNEREGLSGEIVIVRIEFSDGSLWQRP